MSNGFCVAFALSLIIWRKNLTCHQMLLRHLFYSKYVQILLKEVLKANKIANWFTLQVVTGYGQAFALRQKMLNVVQNMEYYTYTYIIWYNAWSDWTHISSVPRLRADKGLECRRYDEITRRLYPEVFCATLCLPPENLFYD